MKPEKLEFGHWFGGRHHDLWKYDEIPPGMRPATLRDLYPGRPVLFRCRIGPDSGKWYSGYFAGNSVAPIRAMVTAGIPVYVKDERR